MSKLRMFAKLKAKKKDDKKAAVEGDAPRQRLDRPSRMRRADGGPISKEREDYAAEKDKEVRDAGAHGGKAALVGGALLGIAPGVKGFKRALTGTGAAAMGAEMLQSGKERRDARRAAEWARSGRAEEGKEDRKRGGRVKS